MCGEYILLNFAVELFGTFGCRWKRVPRYAPPLPPPPPLVHAAASPHSPHRLRWMNEHCVIVTKPSSSSLAVVRGLRSSTTFNIILPSLAAVETAFGSLTPNPPYLRSLIIVILVVIEPLSVLAAAAMKTQLGLSAEQYDGLRAALKHGRLPPRYKLDRKIKATGAAVKEVVVNWHVDGGGVVGCCTRG